MAMPIGVTGGLKAGAKNPVDLRLLLPQHLKTTTNTDDETSPYIAKAWVHYIN
ncbi:hypothetical protein OAO39_03525 [Pirellulaceae bacterium]|nr:hypothetical protein [Pirellulaceae bacterium]